MYVHGSSCYVHASIDIVEADIYWRRACTLAPKEILEHTRMSLRAEQEILAQTVRRKKYLAHPESQTLYL
jgi:hypothetical protein